jgi:hypothetical protein
MTWYSYRGAGGPFVTVNSCEITKSVTKTGAKQAKINES